MRQAIRRAATIAAIALGLLAGAETAAAQTADRRVVVSLADRKLALIVDGEVVRVFPVSVGAPVSPSPIGRFRIVNRLTDPTYYRPGKVIGPGPANPLGTRWIGLDQKGYGIHGTDQPDSIGYARSHGCIRLRNGDVEALFPLLRVGDVVELIDQPTAETARLFGAPAAVVAMAAPAATASIEPSPVPTPSSR